MKLAKCTALLLSLFAAGQAAAETCKVIKWHESKPVKIYAGLYKHVHIILPSDLSIEPINANGLWNTQGKGQHVFITPTSNDDLGRQATISAITVDGKSYDFVAEVNEDKFSACVRIINNQILSNGQLDKISQLSTHSVVDPKLEKQLEDMKARYFSLVKRSAEEKDEAVKQAVRKYRYHIYTRYNWKASTSRKSFVGSDLLTDVYDDGRFTYLRLSSDNKTLPAIEALINGQPEFIEAKYDEVADLYRVVGIYPSLSLKIKDDSITITRADNTSRGEF